MIQLRKGYLTMVEFFIRSHADFLDAHIDLDPTIRSKILQTIGNLSLIKMRLQNVEMVPKHPVNFVSMLKTKLSTLKEKPKYIS